mgnify:CR=1 FL=1
MAGESDMQSGMCLQVEADPETFGDSRTCSWLRNNMGKYGFVFRYPADKEDYTGCTEDLTVIRYVAAATPPPCSSFPCAWRSTSATSAARGENF